MGKPRMLPAALLTVGLAQRFEKLVAVYPNNRHLAAPLALALQSDRRSARQPLWLSSRAIHSVRRQCDCMCPDFIAGHCCQAGRATSRAKVP